MRRSVVLCLLSLLAASLVAGCTGSGDRPSAAAVPGVTDDLTAPLQVVETADGSVLNRDLQASDSLAAPLPWRIGDWFGVHVLFGVGDTEGTHYNTVVVSETASEWVLATDDADAAMDEAVFDLPILGAFAKADLGTSGLGGDWDILQFPLKDGATWTGDVTLDFMQSPTRLEFEATFNPAIKTATGDEPGFDIRAVDNAANLSLEFDYVPSLRWFTKFIMHDTTTPATDDYFVRAFSMGSGDGWTGTYYVDTAESLVEYHNIVGVDPSQVPPTAYTPTEPTATFTVTDDAAFMVGFVFSFAVGGTHDLVLTTPRGEQRQYHATAAETIEEEIREEAEAGEWRVTSAGAGVITGGGAFLWQVFETTGTL